MRKLIVLFGLILSSAVAVSGQETPKKPDVPSPTPTVIDYTEWLFVQSDKALQYRLGVAKKEGTLHYLQLQFKVKSDDEIHCRGAECDGYVLYLSHAIDGGGAETVKYHLYFDASFVGDKIYIFPNLIPIELKTWEDGSKRFLDKHRGLLASHPNGFVERAQYFYNCVDFKLKGQSKTRCDDFDMAKAVRVSESNTVETNSSPPKQSEITQQDKTQTPTDTESNASKILADRKLAKQKEQEAIDAEKQKRDRINQPLLEGVRENYLDVVQAAIKEGASAKAVDRSLMKIAIANAFKTGNDEMLRTLISAGANPNEVFKACYAFPIRLICSDKLKIMAIEAGADVNQTVYVGEESPTDDPEVTVNYPALSREIQIYKSADVVKALIKAGADVNYETPYFKQTPLYQAYFSGCNLEIIKALVDAGADFNHRPRNSISEPMESIYQMYKNSDCKDALLIFKSKVR